MADYTPMMRQFFEMKQANPGCLLMFRLGDFYEMFDEDARIASRELDLTLTTRDRGKEKSEQTPMCGVPYHASENYIARLVNKGHKVAICEQMEDPATAKGLVKREIVRVVTPGSVTESSMLDPGKNNYAAAIHGCDGVFAFCACDASTGVFTATLMENTDRLLDELGRFQPREVLLGGTAMSTPEVDEALKKQKPACIEIANPMDYHEDVCRHTAQVHFKNQRVEELPKAVIMAAGSLLLMLRRNFRKELLHINEIDYYPTGRYLELDLTARRNLELTQNLRTGEKHGSLLWVLDKTKTAMGSRLLRSWVEKPLLERRHIELRQDAVGQLVCAPVQRAELQQLLRQVTDLERVMARIATGNCSARDLRMLADGAETLPQIKELLSGLSEDLWQNLAAHLDTLADLRDEINRTIVPEPPMTVREGGMIIAGCNAELDRLRDIMSGGKGALTEIEQREKEATGIKNLKVGYNRVFGYYIEVSKGQASMVPETYIRKQTLTTGERFITPELKDLEHTILTAREQVTGIEYEIFNALRTKISNNDKRIRKTALSIATADALASLAVVSAENNYCRPYVDHNIPLHIKAGRHPVVEKMLEGSLFVPNDTSLGGEDRVAIITGPNMAGKSTYMRQVALICIMAQIGSFVPAKEAHICLVDRVFTRIGAADDLAGGQSTFMVEMAEVAQILRRATPRSLLILDEIGRGTSTYDGMAIARAVLEFAADPKVLGAKTLFATHYHELSAIEQELEGVRNYNISVKKRQGEMIFLRKIVPGAADRSYGVEVAKLAGLPERVLKRAGQLLKDLEAGVPAAPVAVREVDDQLSMGDTAGAAIREKLLSMAVETMTPIEAMNALYQLRQMAEK